jgi:ribosomal protein S18 acetylase RimI-like enzyme
MLIRPALAAEEAAVTALWRACGLAMPWNDIEAEFRLALGRPNSDILVAVLDERVVGSVMVGHEGHRGWLYYVATDPAFRGQGIARQLIGEAEAWLEARHMPKVQLMVRATNAAVTRYYEVLGYKVVPVAVMQKLLGQGHG